MKPKLAEQFKWLFLAGAVLVAPIMATACSDGSTPPIVLPPSNIHVVALATYEGSGEAVHPDVASTPAGWDGDGDTKQLFVTPYPNGDATKENPSLFTRISSLEWLVPNGVINPIARPDIGYLSDPDQVFNPETNELWLYYRGVNTQNEIFLIRGSGPSRWSPPRLVANASNHSIVSPSVVRRGAGDWLMWAVNSGSGGCSGASTVVELRRSSDGIVWSAPVATDLAETGVFPWHIDVEWIPSKGEFWAAYNVKIPGSCTTAALHFARSTDGLHWNPAAGPVLQREAIPEFADIVYRASFEYDQVADRITLWYSGARFANSRYKWMIATEELSAADFFARIATPPVAGAGLGVTSAPPLTDDDAP